MSQTITGLRWDKVVLSPCPVGTAVPCHVLITQSNPCPQINKGSEARWYKNATQDSRSDKNLWKHHIYKTGQSWFQLAQGWRRYLEIKYYIFTINQHLNQDNAFEIWLQRSICQRVVNVLHSTRYDGVAFGFFSVVATRFHWMWMW